MNESQLSLIRNSCSSAKATLNQLHTSDALLRVNRGQVYESMSTKLMDKFNFQVESSNFIDTQLVDSTNSYKTLLDKFRADYILYEEQLSLAISIDCSKQPVSFYDAVALARTERLQVHTDVIELNKAMSQYQTSLNQFEINFQTNIQGLKK